MKKIFPIILFMCSILSIYFSINLQYGAKIYLFSGFILALTYSCGPWAASLFGMLITCIAYFIFDQPFFFILFGLEMCIVSALAHFKKRTFLELEFMYWILIGSPIIYFTCQDDLIGVFLQISILLLNGLINGLIAEVCTAYSNDRVATKSIFNHVVFIALLLPFLSYITLSGQEMKEKNEGHAYMMIEKQLQFLFEDMYRHPALSLDATMKKYSQDQLFHFAAFSSSNHLLAANERDPFQANFFHLTPLVSDPIIEKVTNSDDQIHTYKSYAYWLPDQHAYMKYEISRWRKGYYIVKFDTQNLLGYSLYGGVAISRFIEQTSKQYILKILFLLFFCALGVGFSKFLQQFFLKQLHIVIELTNDLPGKLKRSKPVKWPQVSWQEIQHLLQNFRNMSDKIMLSFSDLKEMNTLLLEHKVELEHSKEQLAELAYQDTLTNLPNRNYCIAYIEDLVQKHVPMAVLMLSIDRFKNINDSLGHVVGDEVLIEISRHFQHMIDTYFQKDGICARWGGDIFVLVFPHLQSKQSKDVAAWILKSFKGAFSVQEYELFLSLSIGICHFPYEVQETDQLMKSAEISMYLAKENGGQQYISGHKINHQEMFDRLHLEHELHKAIMKNELFLKFQPIINESKEIVAAEALVRWTSMKWGEVPPSEFIPVAENSGLIDEIGMWVLKEACLSQVSWKKPIAVNVNVSLRQLLKHDFLKQLDIILKRTGILPEHLILEITETFMYHHGDEVLQVLNQIREREIRIAVDDFGTGFSSLHRLKEMPVQIVKIDQSFIKKMTEDPKSIAIVSAILSLCHALSLETVAEGVEDETIFDALKEKGCQKYQGYYISEPLRDRDFKKFLLNGFRV